MNSHRSKHRLGASLLEALIATVILLVSVAALSSQATVGARAADRARLQSLASTICQSIVAEHLAEHLADSMAADGLRSTSAYRVSGFSDWMAQFSVVSLDSAASIVDQSADSRLQLMSVTVWQIGRNERLSKTTLSRVVRLSQSSSSPLASSIVKP